jgi:hypothetical protein
MDGRGSYGRFTFGARCAPEPVGMQYKQQSVFPVLRIELTFLSREASSYSHLNAPDACVDKPENISLTARGR